MTERGTREGIESTDLLGRVFQSSYGNKMKVVRKHEKFDANWWCESLEESTGLWAYSETFIREHLLPNDEIAHSEQND